MPNPRYWRKRNLESEKRKLATWQRIILFSELEHDVYFGQMSDRNLRNKFARLGIKLPPTIQKQTRRFNRKLRRMENGTYRRRNRCG